MGRLWAALALGLAAFMASGCNGEPEPPLVQEPAQQTEPEQQQQIQSPDPAQEQPGAPPVRTLELTAADIGSHLEDTTLLAGLPLDLAEMSDPILAALPQRALHSDGALMQPSPQAQTGETFWMHVFTDVSRESATEWVRYLASLPPGTALAFTSPQHELFDSAVRPLAEIGDAAVSVALLHGHQGGSWLTQLVVFAQDGAIVFAKVALRVDVPALSAVAIQPLTDLDAVAKLISDRLRAAPVDSAE